MTSNLAPIHKPSIAYHAPAGALTHGDMGRPERVILHDTECHDAAGISEIEGVVGYWIRGADKLGSHFIVDADGNVGQCGEPTELMYHTGGLNTGSVGIEQIGFASFTEKDWSARHDQLTKVAKLLAWLHTEYKIPLEVPAQQGDGKLMPGVMTHAMVSRFEPASEGHTDPGAGYPLGQVLAIAKAFVAAKGWPRAGGGDVPVTPVAPHRDRFEVSWVDKDGQVRSRKVGPGVNPYRWAYVHIPKSWHRGHVHIQPIHPK